MSMIVSFVVVVLICEPAGVALASLKHDRLVRGVRGPVVDDRDRERLLRLARGEVQRAAVNA